MRASEFVTEQAVTEEINPDCFDPAFNDTQIFDGLTYRATVDEEYGKPVLTIRVLDDNFQQAGVAKFKQSTRGVVSLITSFRPEYQGQGLARNIYAYVRAMGNTIVPSRNQLPPGKAMWDSWKKSGDAKHLMKDVAEGSTITRIDSEPITDFGSSLKAYKHTDDWSQSGVDTGDDSYWKNKNLKTNTTKGLFAGDPKRTALYATGNAHETRYVEFTQDGQPIVYFDRKDLPAMRSRKTYLTVFDANDFRQLPTGEWFSENPGKPIKQVPIGDPFKYIASQGWIVRVTDDLDKVFKQVKNMHKAGKIVQYGAEGMNESKQGVAEGWKDQVASAALAGAMALGNAGSAQAGNDSANAGYHNLPDIVARITMTVNGKTIEKEINLGTQYQSPLAAKQAVAKWLEEKGVKNYTINLERVKSVDEGQQVVAEKIFVSEDAVMGKIEDGGKIVRILKKQHSVPFSDEKNWLLVDVDPAKGNKGLGLKWIPADTRFEWVRPYRDTIEENFADGRNPQDKGDSKRHGINTKASVSSLRKTAKQGGRKGQLAHWLANMKAGRAKAKKKKTNETVIGNLHFPQLSIAVDDHVIDRTRTRGISPASIDQSLRKLNSIADQLGQMESSNTVWVYDVPNNLALGLRRTSSRDMRFTLKTVIAARPFDGPTPVIELT